MSMPTTVVYWSMIVACAVVIVAGLTTMAWDVVSAYRRRAQNRLEYPLVEVSESLHRSMAARRGWQTRRARAAERARQREQADAQSAAERRPVTAETRRKRFIVIHDDDNGGQ